METFLTQLVFSVIEGVGFWGLGLRVQGNVCISKR